MWVQYVWHTGRLEGEGERGGGGGHIRVGSVCLAHR